MGNELAAFTAVPLLIFAVIVAVAIAVSLAIGKAAERKGRSRWAFFWISFLLFPLGAIVMGIIVATLADPEPRP